MKKYLLVVPESSVYYWYTRLSDSNLRLGEDYRWSWYQDNFAIEFEDNGALIFFFLKFSEQANCSIVEVWHRDSLVDQ